MLSDISASCLISRLACALYFAGSSWRVTASNNGSLIGFIIPEGDIIVPMKWFTWKRVLVLAAIILVGLFVWRWQANRAKAKAEIKTATVARHDVVSTLVASGKIVADKSASLNFPLSGKLGFVNVKTGDTVKAYQTLAGMDVADLDTAITKAFYTYEAADAAAKLAEDSVKDHAGDETFAQKNTRVAAQTARDSAYDAWMAARRAKTNSYLVSPFVGVVTAVTVTSAGDTVSITDGITVVDPTSLRFQGEVDETDIGKIFVNQPVTLKMDAFPEQKFVGTVDRIAFQASLSDTGGTVYLINIKLSAEDTAKLRLGENGDVTIVLAHADNVLTIPVDSVVDGQVTQPDGSKRKIETGLAGDTLVEIKSGLTEGETIVVQ